MNKKNKGFTIVEILIVLAIVGLIMLIMFMSVPALQRRQRDERRRRDLGLFWNAVHEYQVNSGNKNTPFQNAPGDTAAFNSFVSEYFSPLSSQYTMELKDWNSSHAFPYVEDAMVFFPRHFCATDTADIEEVTQSTGNHPMYAWSVLVALESTHDYVCVDQGNKDI